MKSLYQYKEGQPFHISVGAVLVNDDGEILVHKREQAKAGEKFADNFDNFVGRDTVYILMRESLEDEESLVECALRGIREEFGMSGVVEKYLGSIIAPFTNPRTNMTVEKLTAYFLVTSPKQVAEREEDGESFSELVWKRPEFLIEHMRGQGGGVRKDLDESKIIEAYVKYN